MGSVMSAIKCPTCGLEGWEDFYYKSGEVYMGCEYCGYYEEHDLDRDLMKKEGISLFSDIKERHWRHKKIEKSVVVRQTNKSGGGAISHWEVSVEDAIKSIMEQRRDLLENKQLESITLSWFEDGRFYTFDLRKCVRKRIYPEPEFFEEAELQNQN